MKKLLAVFLILNSCYSLFAQSKDTSVYQLPYDKTVFVTTHNSYNHSPFHLFPNQCFSVKKQLNDGVRSFMLDIYLHKGKVEMYHVYRVLGHSTLLKTLFTIRKFLESHPTEVLTILFECYVPFEKVEPEFEKAGLMKFVHSQPKGKPWPTVKEMIASGKRLVVFSSCMDFIPDNWYHYEFDYVSETPYANHKISDFDFCIDRGYKTNTLFVLNNFLYGFKGTGSFRKAKKANNFRFLLDRGKRFMVETGKIPNFLTVDFYNRGNVFKVADSLNKIILKEYLKTR